MKKAVQMFLVFLMMVALVGCNEISGEVTDEDGQPLEGVTITLTSDDSGEITTTATDVDGAYRFSNLNIGDYTVEASYEGLEFEGSPASVSINYSDDIVDFVGYISREPAMYDLGGCGVIPVQLFSQKVADTGEHSGIINVDMEISQTVSGGGSSTFTCYLTEYDNISLSGEIDGATYTATEFPEETITIDTGSYEIRIEIDSLEFTATGECDFNGTAGASIRAYWGWFPVLSVTDSSVAITTDF